MKTYIPVGEDAEYRAMFDSYNQTVENLNDTDFLYESMLSNGQVFFAEDGVYGTVNGQPALRNTNILISRSEIDDFKITNFKLFTRATNTLITLDINCNLANYRDNKIHYLYVVLDPNGTYEVYDDMFQSDETKILFARFIIGSNGDSKQFYMMLPFAGSADYIKGNQFYQVTDGLRVKVISGASKQLTLTKAKIRFSAINFDDKASPDCITIDHNGSAVPIRYVYWDSNTGIPRTDWDSTPVYVLNNDTIMNYTTGVTTRISSGKFSIQKLYYDVYLRCIVALYGNAAYNSREDAVYAIDTVMSYPLPDGMEYLIPIACIVMENTEDPISDSNFKIINLDYNEQEVLDSDTFTRQQAAEAVSKANQAVSAVATVSTNLNNHAGNLNNPHQVKLNQLLKSNGTAGAIDDSFAESGLSVTALINRTLSRVGETYYAKSGGTISGNTSITGTLSVAGQTTLHNTIVSGDLRMNGNITYSTAYNIGSSTYPADEIFAHKIITSADGSKFGNIETGNIMPKSSMTYNLGSSGNMFNNGYFNMLNVYTDFYTSSVHASDYATLGNSTQVGTPEKALYVWGRSEFLNDITLSTSNNVSLNIKNGYLIIGGYGLRLGGSGSIPTQTGYGIW